MNKIAELSGILDGLLDDGIDHVMLINERGRVESSVSRNEIAIPKDKREIFSMGFRLHQSLLQEFDEEFGPVEQFVVVRTKAKIVSVPLGSRNLIFVMDNMHDHKSVIGKTGAMKNYDLLIRGLDEACAEAIANG